MITSWPGRRLDAPVVHVEAVREEDRGAVGQVRRDLGLVEPRLRAVRDEERDELCTPHRVGDRAHGQAGLLGSSA